MRRLCALIAILAAALLLAGCNGCDDPPDTMSTWTPSGTPEAPTSATPTDNPLTEAPAQETAKQFLKRWTELSNEVQRTGKADAYLQVVGPDCDSCRDFAARVSAFYENGGYVHGGQETILDFSEESPTQWVVTVRATPTEYVEKAGAEIQRIEGGRYKSRIYLAKVNHRWIVGSAVGVPL